MASPLRYPAVLPRRAAPGHPPEGADGRPSPKVHGRGAGFSPSLGAPLW
jgi:hypothetical protein